MGQDLLTLTQMQRTQQRRKSWLCATQYCWYRKFVCCHLKHWPWSLTGSRGDCTVSSLTKRESKTRWKKHWKEGHGKPGRGTVEFKWGLRLEAKVWQKTQKNEEIGRIWIPGKCKGMEEKRGKSRICLSLFTCWSILPNSLSSKQGELEESYHLNGLSNTEWPWVK